jgi:hypothetical protein
MKNFGLFGVAVAGVAALGACSSTSTTDAAGAVSGQTSAARARFAGGPTALFTTANGARALSETKRQQTSGADAMKGNPLGGSGSGVTTASIGIRSLRILDVDAGGAGASASCADIAAGKDKGSCACPGGGTVAYDVPNLKALQAQSQGAALPDEISIAFTYQACSMEQKTYGGAMSMLLSKKSVVNVGGGAPATPATPAGLNMLVVASELTIDDQKLDFAFAMDGGQFYYAPSVDDQGGYVLTELSFSGGTKVHAKNGTFDCSGVDDTGAGQCTSDTGETVPVGSGGGNGTPGDDAGLGSD